MCWYAFIIFQRDWRDSWRAPHKLGSGKSDLGSGKLEVGLVKWEVERGKSDLGSPNSLHFPNTPNDILSLVGKFSLVWRLAFSEK